MRNFIPLILSFVFLLGIRDGYVALRRDGEDTWTVFPYRAELLPEADRRRLAEGIVIRDEAELARLLEDYLS